MRKYIIDYVKNCPDCIKYKASNQKLSGLLQTPVPAQRFETLAIDLFGQLPESKDGKRWILIIEDCTTKWVELFALPNATAKECAITLIEEVLLREVVEEQQDSRKFYADKKRKAAPTYQPGEHVFVASHPRSKAAQGRSAKLMPRREVPTALLVEWLRQQTKLLHLSEVNPQVYVETPLHPEKLTVWCALWAGGIIGPYFFKNDEGHNVTVNGDRYRAMITNFFIPELNNHDVQELWFQQDGATCHTARATIDLLKDTFGDRLISRFGLVNRPPRSCDLTPLDYFLWGYVKSLVYADKPQTLDHLADNIRRVIADIRPQMLEKVIEN
ncbi:uncharacterized protein TNCV_253081 [Trichonephila clavipes]|nr:uncharacterized protein TNCV_253081 [Trichonephila clavipes]